jgi:Arc/MetJ-type ribon-helix-helix transcriptional regulator
MTTGQPRTATLEAEVPQRLLGEMQELVTAGWFRSLDEIVVDALRRFVESHRGELMDEQIREDVEWGLRGAD